jgi:hypothetical protein
MIPAIRNPVLRRTVLVLTVLGVVVCLGPLHLVLAGARWFEREFDVDLGAVWRGVASREEK